MEMNVEDIIRKYETLIKEKEDVINQIEYDKKETK